MKRLHLLLKAVMLRRTKDATIGESPAKFELNTGGKPILNLPPRVVNIVPCEFDSDERAFYEALEQRTELAFSKVSARWRIELIFYSF